MSNATAKASSGGIGFFGLLTILFIGLKLTHYVDWSWWWVTAPLWGPMAFAAGLTALIAIFALIGTALAKDWK